ncbi:twin-arginine translocation signal domain-containing protein [Bradyrhizobium sp. LLZ17]|uniref:Twin-arginine translocation signal domain-containing protein n=1 Tax=Bradyrhizobium sp. LLZ17 TaxID=3239388 RepID=A0AB39XL49_9BRAD
MNTKALGRGFLAASVVLCGISGSLAWSKTDGLSFSITSAEARVGRPLTPMSYAGVARRTTRRAVVGGAAVGGAAVGCHRVMVNGVWVCR